MYRWSGNFIKNLGLGARRVAKIILILAVFLALTFSRSAVVQRPSSSADAAPPTKPAAVKRWIGVQYCYVKHRSPDFFKDYPLNSAFEAVHVYPRPYGVGEGQSAFVFLESGDLDYIRRLNAGNPQVVNWMMREDNGSLYRSPQPGAVTDQAQWFPILLSGNIVKITEVVGQRGRVDGLTDAALRAGSVDRESTPYFIHWVSVIWRDGRVTNTPRGYGLMPIYDPADFRSKAISEMWVSMDDLLCPIDLSRSFMTRIDPSRVEGVALHRSPQLGEDNLLGSRGNAVRLFPLQMGGEPFHIWQVTRDGTLTWGLTDWGYLLLRDGTHYNVTWRGG